MSVCVSVCRQAGGNAYCIHVGVQELNVNIYEPICMYSVDFSSNSHPVTNHYNYYVQYNLMCDFVQLNPAEDL